MKFRIATLFLSCLLFCNIAMAQELVSILDAALEKAIREHLAYLKIPADEPITQEEILLLTGLEAQFSDITDLTGLEHAKNLVFLDVGANNISDIQPLAGLTKLEVLKLFANDIEDISPVSELVNLKELQLENNIISDLTPLAGLTRLEYLSLGGNRIEDISPLSKLVNLTELWIDFNNIQDFTPLAGLTQLKLLNFRENPADVTPILGLQLENFGVCEVEGSPVKERIENRDYPSVFAAWAHIINLPTVLELDRLAYHDLYFCCPMFGLYFLEAGDNIYLAGDINAAIKQREKLLAENPNMILLVAIPYFSGVGIGRYPDDWGNWLRDENGEIVIDPFWGESLLDFTRPSTQQWTIAHAHAVAQCGLFDGIFLDHWNEGPRLAGYRRVHEEYAAREQILKGIREITDDDFLIMVNTNNAKIPRWASHINGTFMEVGATQHTEFNKFQSRGYTADDLPKIESTLLWSELNMREPQINGLETFGLIEELPDSLRNQQWMRMFTTMGLTHSDGYVLYSIGSGSLQHEHHWDNEFLQLMGHANNVPHVHDHDHYWYNFWDAPLGKPIGGDETKAQTYNGTEGLFIREFTNGWAVYNRSGKTQQITLPEQVSGWHSQVDGTEHQIADLDGEIYIRVAITVDVNSDGVVNILDLVIVANSFGETDPQSDVNGDGVVNILDLVVVANNFSG